MRGTPAPLASRTVTVDGNRLVVLPDGPDRLDAILDMIGTARSSVRLLYYIFAGDGSGTAGARGIARGAAARGRGRRC